MIDSAYMWTLIGESGDGKTYTAATLVENEDLWPFIVIDTDGGTESMARTLAKSKGCRAIVSNCRTHLDVVRALKRAEASKDIRAVIYDGITATHQNAKDDFIERLSEDAISGTGEKQKRAQAKLDPMSRESKTLALDMGREASPLTSWLVGKLNDLKRIHNKNVVVTAWRGNIYKQSKQKNGKIEFEVDGLGPALSDRPARRLQLASDFMWYLQREPSVEGNRFNREKLVTVAYTRPSDDAYKNAFILAKSRGDLYLPPAKMINPHLGDFYKRQQEAHSKTSTENG